MAFEPSLHPNGSQFLVTGEAGAILGTTAAAAGVEWSGFHRITVPVNGYRLEWKSTAGLAYHVERSPNLLAPWTALPGSPVTAGAAGI